MAINTWNILYNSHTEKKDPKVFRQFEVRKILHHEVRSHQVFLFKSSRAQFCHQILSNTFFFEGNCFFSLITFTEGNYSLLNNFIYFSKRH